MTAGTHLRVNPQAILGSACVSDLAGGRAGPADPLPMETDGSPHPEEPPPVPPPYAGEGKVGASRRMATGNAWHGAMVRDACCGLLTMRFRSQGQPLAADLKDHRDFQNAASICP